MHHGDLVTTHLQKEVKRIWTGIAHRHQFHLLIQRLWSEKVLLFSLWKDSFHPSPPLTTKPQLCSRHVPIRITLSRVLSSKCSVRHEYYFKDIISRHIQVLAFACVGLSRRRKITKSCRLITSCPNYINRSFSTIFRAEEYCRAW